MCVFVSAQASAETMRMLAQTSPGCAFEKASIDEAYIDVTQLAVSVKLCSPLAAGTHTASLLPHAVVSAAYRQLQRALMACFYLALNSGGNVNQGPTCRVCIWIVQPPPNLPFFV